MSCMFVVGWRAKDNSLVDIAYDPAFLLACWGTWLLGSPPALPALAAPDPVGPLGGCDLACISAFGIAVEARISATGNFAWIGVRP